MSRSFPVVMITGARQAGKTTLLSIIKEAENEKINYVSLDDLSARALAVEDPEMFLEKYKYPVIIDEFQYAPNLLSYIKIIVDKLRLESLKNDDELFIPSIKILEQRKSGKRLELDDIYQKILKGNYPVLYSDENVDRIAFLSTYIKTYIERDIRELINVKDEIKF